MKKGKGKEREQLRVKAASSVYSHVCQMMLIRLPSKMQLVRHLADDSRGQRVETEIERKRARKKERKRDRKSLQFRMGLEDERRVREKIDNF